MKWTTTPPAEPGWYCLRFIPSRPFTVCRVWRDRSNGRVYAVDPHRVGSQAELRDVDLMTAEWAGPIPRPEEADA